MPCSAGPRREPSAGSTLACLQQSECRSYGCSAADGNTYFAETPEDAPGIFAEEFEGLATLVGQNVSIEIRPTDEVKLLGVLNDYPAVAVPDGIQVQIGDAYGSERRRLIFALHIPELAALGPARVADVVLRYVAVGAEVVVHELTIPVTVNLVSADEAATADIDHEVVEEIWLLQAARARKDAIDAADVGDYGTAQSSLRTTAANLRSYAPSSMRAAELIEEADQLEAHADRADTSDPMWRKRVRSEQWRRSRGRPKQ